ncbi:MAG: mandelate racemase/muconate lactonizing enzyme family protein [Clostridia bacterium]|nr:mandelate racemase/muconate lactonizing enzyme family protein [Clostridia bacterium]
MMKIIDLKHRAVSIPVEYPVVSCVRHSEKVVFVLLDVVTDAGITGISYAQAFHKYGANAVRACLDFFKTVVVNEDPRSIEKIWRKMWESAKLLGQGITTFALSMIDMALWDILAKSMNQPLYRLLGGQRTSLDVYASQGLWLVSPEVAVQQAESFAAQGFKAMKMRLGRENSQKDLKVLAAIRKAVGEEIEILGDVNQGWSVKQTLEMAPKLFDLGLYWLEEPIEANNLEGYMVLMEKLSVPIAAGENLYGVGSFHNFLQAGGSRVYTPDLQRIGGISGWKRIISLLENYNVSVSVHLFPELAVHLLAGLNNSEKMEWMTWAGPLFREPLECKAGKVEVPARPGFGMEWDEERIKEYQI